MKKIFLIFSLLIAVITAKAQGLEGFIVENFYEANAADAAGSVGVLPAGSKTFRFYVDLAPGYKLQAVYGSQASPTTGSHELRLITTTAFYNNEDRCGTSPNAIGQSFQDDNTVMLDSWLSVGGASAARLGILKSEDDGVGTVVNSNGLLQNSNAFIGIPLTTQDGQMAGTPEPVTFVGFPAPGADLSIFDCTSNAGNSFITDNASYASLNGSVGPTAANKVLIAQITTNGVLQYAFNIQIGTPTGGVENYVWGGTPVANEQVFPALAGTLNQANACPTVSITAPAGGSSYLVNDIITIDATAADADGTVAQVEFFVNNVSVGVDNTAPYTINYTATSAGTKNIFARATDNLGCQTNSSVVSVSVGSNSAPVVSITSPSNGATFVLGDNVTINATASDADGSITQVEFFVNNVSLSVDPSSPYSASWLANATGPVTFRAVATDNNNATASAQISVTVFDSSSAYALISASIPCGDNKFCLPLNAIVPVDDVIGYDIVLDYDQTKVSPTGVVVINGATVNPSWVSVASSNDATNGILNLSAFFNGSAPSNAEFNGSGEVLCIEFARTANFLGTDVVSFNVTSLQESYFVGVQPKVVSPGTVSTFSEVLFTSELRFWSDNSTLGYDGNGTTTKVTNIYGNNSACTNQSATAVQPDALGTFLFDINGGDHINIERQIDNTTSVQAIINGFDAFLTRRVLINDATYTPSVYEILSMDVNLDGVISAGDLSQINQRAILQIGEFKQAWNYNSNGTPIPGAGPSKDWRFIDLSSLNSDPAYQMSATYPANDNVGYSKAKVPVPDFCLPVPVFSTTGCDVIGNETYIGYVVGDVNGNFAAVGSGGLFRQTESAIVFDLENAIVNGNFIDVPVLAISNSAISSIDFSAIADNSKLKYHSIVNVDINAEHLSHYNVNDNAVRFTSFNLNSFETDVPVAFVRFETSASEITGSDFISTEGFINGNPVEVSFKRGLDLNDSSINIYPNPANESFNINVSEDSKIVILTMEGKVAIEETNVKANENLTIETTSLSPAIYLIKVYNPHFNEIRKLVISR